MPATRRQLLARLHCIRKEHGWDEDAYRDIIEARTRTATHPGYRSAGDMPVPVLARLVADLGNPGNEWAWVNKVAAEKQTLLWKIRRICLNLGIAHGQQIAYAEGVAARIAGHERHLRMMDAGELWKLIGPLERTARYKRQGETEPAA